MVRGPMVVLLLAVTVARADDQPQPLPLPAVEPEASGFVAGGLLVGGDRYLNGAFSVEVGIALPQPPLWLHFMANLGSTVILSFEPSAPDRDLDYLRAIAGIELRRCRLLSKCLFLDLDAGYQSQSGGAPGDMETHRGVWIGPRIGFDVGRVLGIRVRGALELYEYRHSAVTSAGSSVAWEDGASLVFSLGYQL